MSPREKKIGLTILVILVAANLRAPFTGVGALVNTISTELNLSLSATGSLTTLPVLAFAAVSPLAVWGASRLGTRKVLSTSMLVICIGVLVRSFCGDLGLFAGTLIIGVGIASGNVLLPAIIKTGFPDRIESMTGMYTAVMQLVSAVSTAISVPLALTVGWRWSLAVWLVPAAVAVVCALCCGKAASFAKEATGKTNIYRYPLTWWLTSYMGVQSMIFYSCIAWLSPIMQGKGYTSVEAGYLLSVYVILGIIGSCCLPSLMKWNQNQSATGVQLGVLYLVGILLLLFGKGAFLLIGAIVICGFSAGAFLSFLMALFGLRSANGEVASQISGIAQTGGYLMAAVGPILMGKLYDVTGSWTVPLVVLAAATVYLIFVGWIAGKDRVIGG